MHAARTLMIAWLGWTAILPAGLAQPVSDAVDSEAPADESADSLRAKLAQEVEPAVLDATWYRPHMEHKGQRNPLAVVLASATFPVSTKDYWVPTLWRENFCALVLQTKDQRSWSSVRAPQVIKEINDPPAEVPSDGRRVLIIADAKTGPMALQLLDGYADRIVGAVLISVLPVDVTPTGPALWSPRQEVWKVPIWSVAGTRASDAATALEMWRKVAAIAPPKANITVDARLDRGLGHLLPDPAIEAWLKAIQEGKAPARGPDRQAEAQRREYKDLAQRVRREMSGASPPLEAGEGFSKKDGPFDLSVTAPQGWIRDEDGEKEYNPTGSQVDEKGRTVVSGRNPYAELYLTPKRRGPFFARIRAARCDGDGAKVLDDFDRMIAQRGYLPVSILRWKDGRWTFDVSSVLLVWGERWHRWTVLSAVDNTTPAAPFIAVLDATKNPDPAALVGAMKRLILSVRVGWIGSDSTGPKKLDEGE